MSKRGPTGLAPQTLFGPAFLGLNTERADIVGLEDSRWALVLENIRWSRKGKPELRLGYVKQNTALSGAPTLWNVHEYVRADQTTELVAIGSDHKMWHSTDDGVNWADITGTISTVTSKWVFANFFDELYATAPGHQIYVYTGSGSFALVANSPVTRGVLLSAYGRLWAAVDASAESSIQYCALLDGSDWTGTDTGTIDASNAWTRGQDTVNALFAFGASFIVFGSKQILIYVDGAGSVEGIDPDNMYVVDTIEGTGTTHPMSIIAIGKGDLWFLSKGGVQSFGRLIADKNNVLTGISDNVRTLVNDLTDVNVSSDGYIQAAFDSSTNSAMYLFPASNKIVYFDARSPLQDGTYRSALWTDQAFSSVCARQNGTVVFGMASGYMSLQTGYQDNATGDITIKYASPWLDWGQDGHHRLKILKEASILAYGHEDLDYTLRWAVDYRPLEFSVTGTLTYTATGDEYAIGEYAVAEYGTGLRNRKDFAPLEGEGQFIQFQLEIANSTFHENIALQEVTLYAKPGTMV